MSGLLARAGLHRTEGMPVATLHWHAGPAHAGVVVLVLHGGAVEGRQRNRPWSHNVARLVPFARAFARMPGDAAVARLTFRHRGWNGPEQDPVVDARWALAQVRATHPGVPIVLVGHSMGGRVALHLADEPDVRLVVGLSAWIEDGDPVPSGTSRIALLHGDRDILCPLWMARGLVEQLGADRHPAALVRIARADHAMLVRARLWTVIAVGTVQAALAAELGVPYEPPAGPVGAAVTVAALGEGVVDV
ncbi:serine aminopeptidase S33 family [Terracoccus luteus]|uniref:Serine aminopeptidase S33 family n=1 Tax=Terracoccus luteus TaxID=53356 RepID=A0A495XY44_9MICO|nr:alpha/beta fold hydrolase [Terracoccus luteus]RKT79207.1 serine aminopeptidase S33 family [Terracoccus luteus]